MNAAKVDFKRRETRRGRGSGQCGRYLAQTQRKVVMDASFFCCRKIFLSAAFQPAGGYSKVVKTDGANGPCRVTIGASFGTRRILTEQAACRFFL